MFTLNTLKSNKKKKKRLGRGSASGKGNYSGKGMKGQKSRSGAKIRRGFEGGQTPWYRKIPKYKGMKRRYPKYQLIDFDLLNQYFQSGDLVSPKILLQKGAVKSLKRYRGIKILGRGELKIQKLKIKKCKLSKTVKKALGIE